MINARSASRIGLSALLSIVSVALSPSIQAQGRAEQGDPPTRVARLSYLDGSVSMQPGGDGEWGNAVRNRPITVGDKLWVDKDSRAELQAGQASIHLGSMTALSFLNLDEGITQMRLAEGSVNFRVRELRQGDIYEVDTPNLAFTVKQAGAFRIDVGENGDGTRVTVIRGEGDAIAGGKSYEIHTGERGEFNGIDNIQYSVDRAPRPDGLDRWANERDLKEDNSVSARYVSRDTPGYSDLDDYGTWDDVPTYGHVWYPTVVDVGWAPYSYGYWNWVGPWGWTWVDYAPWGFAPFHYGRWAFIGSRWGWCPGPVFAQPFYGPAFVGFFGGSHFFASVGFGSGIGWFPLGWGEPFHPWFHSSPRFVNNINIHNTVINTTIINNNHFNNFAFAHDARAVTVASHNAFVNGERINRGSVRVTEASLRGAQVMRNPGLNPTRQSHFGAENAGGRVSAPPSGIQNRQVMARTAPAAAASHMPVRTLNARTFASGRVDSGNAPGGSAVNGRQGNGGFDRPGPARNAPMPNGRDRQLSPDRPPSARPDAGRGSAGFDKVGNARVSSGDRPGNGGFDRPGPARNAPMPNGRDRVLSPDRPPSARPDAGRANAGFDKVGNARVSSGDRPGNGGFDRPGPARNAPMPNGRDRVLSPDRPPSARPDAGRGNAGFDKVGNARVSSGDRPGGGGFNRPDSAMNGNHPPSRTWDAQGNTTDRGRAPQDFGRGNAPAQSGRTFGQSNRNDRPEWAGSGANSGASRDSRPSAPSYGDRSPNAGGSRSYEPPQRSAPSYSGGGRNRDYAPQRSYEPPSRSYSPPSRSYSEPSRTYSAPSRSYPAPSRSYSPPSRGYSGGGGNYRGDGGGGSSSRGGGGGSSPRGGGSSSRGGGSSSHTRN